jgi:ankyrin repeat protein
LDTALTIMHLVLMQGECRWKVRSAILHSVRRTSGSFLDEVSMKPRGSIAWHAALDEYEHEAQALLGAVESANREIAEGGDREPIWRFKWEHPRFHGRSVADVESAALDLADARIVIAREHGFHGWDDLREFIAAVERDAEVRRFEAAVDAVVTGDLEPLRSAVRLHPELSRRRSTRRHQATLLHYVAANGVEHGRQRTPPNALEICRLLLDAGAEPDALADMYDARCTTMSLLVSSTPPAEAGLQSALAELLLDHGAALEGPGSPWTSALMTALVFGFPDTAEVLARRAGAAVTSLPVAAGLGRIEDARRLLPAADASSRHAALAVAAQLGRPEIVRLLLDVGEDLDRYNPDGFHSHATPLHQAVWGNHATVVRLLIERGARLDQRDSIYDGTPLGWALHGRRAAIATRLREHGAPE